jgi:RNA polymerase sigma factor (sigma-70 family)
VEELSDEELATMLLEGKEDALALLYAKHSGRATAVAQGIVKDGSLAEDIVAKVFYRACEKVGSLKNRGNLKSWLFRSVVREAVLQGKRRARMLPIEPDEPDHDKRVEISTPVAPPLVDRRDLADRLYDKKLLRFALMEGLAVLGDFEKLVAYRELVRWGLGEQYVPTQQKLAELMGMSRDAYQRLRSKAMNDLKKALSERRKDQ